MKIRCIVLALAAITTVFLGTPRLSAGDEKREADKAIEKRMIEDAKKTADKAERDSKKRDGNYEVKKSHDPGEHFTATEKAAANGVTSSKPTPKDTPKK